MTDAPPRNAAGGSLTVVIAPGANLLVARAETVTSVLTGSGSMVAEAAPSWADFGNEIFLLVADRRSMRERDSEHPLGYGRETYVWSMFAAIVLIDRNRRFLIGEMPDVGLRNTVLANLLARREIDRVTYLHLEFVGPSRVFLVAAVDLVGEDTETHVAYSLRRVEEDLRTDEHIEEVVLSLDPGRGVAHRHPLKTRMGAAVTARRAACCRACCAARAVPRLLCRAPGRVKGHYWLFPGLG